MTDAAVLDLSNHDYATFDPACLYASGVRKVVVGCWDVEITLDIVARARAVGIDASELYCFMYPGLPWEQREVMNALSVHRKLGGILIGWPDCESQFTEYSGDLDTEAAGTTSAGRIAALRSARRLLAGAGMRLGTYTGEPWWRANMGNTDEFSGDPLWLANYGSNDPANPRPPITEVAFGGWTSVYRHQYSSTIVRCGRNRDHNYEIHVAAEEEDMTAIEDMQLAMFAGSEQITKDPQGNPLPSLAEQRAERLAYAQGRIAEIAAGNAPSLVETGAANPVGGGNPIDARALGRAVAQAGSIITSAGVALQGGA